MRGALGAALPETGKGPEEALRAVVSAMAAGAADPADPWCVGHLHCPPLAVGVAADLAASALNQSMDSWDQAPAACALEDEVTAAMARLVFPTAEAPAALVTTGGTESNLVGLLLARERLGPDLQVVCGVNAHHTVARACWLLGLRRPLLVAAPGGMLDPGAVATALGGLEGPAAVVATAGVTDTGTIDPLAALAGVVDAHRAWLHVDAAYGGAVLFSDRLRPLLDGIDRAHSVALDLHKFGWLPVASGFIALPDAAAVGMLAPQAAGAVADYLSADDDVAAGLPDLLDRSLRTSRRPDVVKMAVAFRALGRQGLAGMLEHCCDTAIEVADAVAGRSEFELWARPTLSTVVFRPTGADDESVAEIRRRLLHDGRAVLGRADLPGPDGSSRRWLKFTFLHPHAGPADYLGLLDVVAATAAAVTGGSMVGETVAAAVSA